MSEAPQGQGPKVLLLDIETAPNIAYTWGLWKQNIAINQIVKPGHTLCWAAKWLGDDDPYFYSIHEDGEPEMIGAAWELLNEADIVVHYNGKKFDIPVLQKEFILNDLPPPYRFKQVDLYQVVRSQFRFASNKLDYVSQQLGMDGKLQHKGMDLWRDCMNGDPAAWEIMEEYNVQDVIMMEPLYRKLLPWIPNHPNMGLYVENPDEPVCRACGSTNVKQNGWERLTAARYKRYKCNDCGTNMRGRFQSQRESENVLV